MKTARTSMLAAGILALCGLAAIEAQGTGERGPETSAPNLQGRSEAAPPPQQLPDGQGAEAEAPSANDEAPSPRQGCPDRGRKLELIV